MHYKIAPWTHQRATTEKMTLPGKVCHIVHGEVGVGKTLIAINTLRTLCYRQNRLLRTVIVGPKAVLVNWKREIEKHSEIKDIYVVSGTAKKKKEILAKALQSYKGIIIVNYEAILSDYVRDAIWNFGPEVLVYDELHLLKSHDSKRSKEWFKVSRMASYRYGLTGTPVLNATMDLFQQFKVIDLGATFGDNFWSFRNTYFVDLNASMPSHVKFPNWQPRKELASDFQSKVSMLTTSLLKKDYLDLPDIVKVQREVELSAEQQRMYKQMEKDYVAFLEDKECTAQLALTKSLRLMQIATGYVTMDDGEDHVFKTNPRIEELKQLVSEITSQGHKVIVWAHFRKNHEFIRKAMDDIKVDWVNYVGGMKTADQQEAIDRFQNDPNCKVFIGSQSAAGTGITLTAASYAIWYSRGYKYGDDHQSEGRFHRGGAEIHESLTRIDMVAPGTIDVTIANALRDKKNVAQQIMEGRYGRK